MGIFLLGTLFLPITSSFWRYVDTAFFQWLNFPLKENSFLRNFWALANHRLADWIGDLFILGFYSLAVWKTPKENRPKRIAEFIFCVLLTAFTILLINRLLCRDLLRLRRASPTLTLPNAVYLNDFISWISVKVDSAKSFPGDHATTALMFACSYAYLVRGRLGVFALLYAGFLCLPRLAVGAHWLSDIIVGSGCIVLFSLSWVFFTPLADKCVSLLTRLRGRKWGRQ